MKGPAPPCCGATMLKPTCCSDAPEGVNDGVVLAVGTVGALEL